jgi:hypothetical protein
VPDTVLANKQSVAFALDGVAIKLETSFLPGESFVVADRGEELQAAMWSTITPASELAIMAVPFGTRPPTEMVPPAASGIEKEYYQGFDDAREIGQLEILAQTKQGPTITIFGKDVVGRMVVSGAPAGDSGESTPILTVEWVGEGGNRLWIVRATHELAPGISTLGAVKSLRDSLAGMVLSSDTLDHPTTLVASSGPLDSPMPSSVPMPPGSDADEAPPELAEAAEGLPTWWNGDCDTVNFKARDSMHRNAFRLNNGFLGVVPCGPIPGPTGDVTVQFPDAQGRDFKGHGEFEFQCVELCMRFMQVVHGITAYPGNGSQVVPNFLTMSKPKDRGKMVVIQNGQFPPAPMPGDILSYGPVSTVGHTSVCTASNVDSQGNGTITIMQQNVSLSGKAVLRVQNWKVIAVPGVTSFLHATTGSQPQPLLPDATPVRFNETGHFIGGGFKALWFKPGNGIFLCGFPLTDEQAEGNLTVQFFENVRMEFRPGIQPRFGGVGRAFVEHPNSNVPAGVEPTGPGTRRFNDTGHSVGGSFLTLFNKYGLDVCGFPLTGEIDENGVTAQYFENVRMERSAATPARFGAVGRRFLQLTGVLP